MRLSARADYALRAAIELAAAKDGHVTAEQLAQAQHIPGKFLETILTHLRRSGLVRSQRGPDGGFWLARPANEISLADIIRAIETRDTVTAENLVRDHALGLAEHVARHADYLD